jgi:hypothetical protein
VLGVALVVLAIGVFLVAFVHGHDVAAWAGLASRTGRRG